MSNYTKNTNFTAKDNLTSGDPAKVIKGAEFDTEFNALQTAVNSKADSNNSQLTGTTDAQAVETTGDVTVGGNLSVTGNATIEGNLTFGNADTDTVSFVADVDSSIIPDDDNTYDLGSATKQWRNVYVDGTANIDSLVADTADINGGTIDGVSISGSTASFSGEISANGGIALGDNDKATFGTGDDLQIYHDGSDSYIVDVATGSLNIQSNGPLLSLLINAGEKALTAGNNGAVTAYYDNSAKLATTSTGIDVTGTVTADGLTVDGTADITSISGNAHLTIARNGFTAWDLSSGSSYFQIGQEGANPALYINSGRDVYFYEDTGTTAKMVWSSSAESLGIGGSPTAPLDVRRSDTDGIVAEFHNSVGYGIDIGSSTAEAYISSGFNQDFLFKTNAGGGQIERMRIDSVGNVGIGTNSPSERLDVRGSVNGTHAMFSGQAGRGLVIGTENTLNNDDGVSYNAQTSSGKHLFKTNDTERMRIDSSGRVGIGTASPALAGGGTGLHINATSYPELKLTNNTTGTGAGDGSLIQGNGSNLGIINRESGNIEFQTSNTERARLDSSGNLLVGKTSTNSLGVDGHDFGESGYVMHTRDYSNVMYLNRRGNDGEIQEFYKDGSKVGSIGTEGNDLWIGNTNTALQFIDNVSGDRVIRPFDISTNSRSDNTTNLGYSNSRFIDLYLSGGVYLGGTGSANKLDDYETGTWTPTISFDVGGGGFSATSVIGRYVKVGDLVTVTFMIEGMSGVSGGDYYARLSGLPFSPISYQQKIRVALHNTGNTDFWITVASGGGLMYASSAIGDYARGDDFDGNTITGSYTYQVT